MSKTTTYRYEVSSPGYGVIEHVQNREEAKTVAQNWIEREHLPVEIYDRMARTGKPQLWTVTACTAEAHSNPFIDHCYVCAPNWGIVVNVKELKGKPSGPVNILDGWDYGGGVDDPRY
jgi:hypothetical protein